MLLAGLRNQGYAVRGFDLTPGTTPFPGDVVGSISDPGAVESACDGVDSVIHLAGVSQPGADWDSYLQTNISGTRAVLEAARLRGVRGVVLASSNHAVGYVRETPGSGAVPGEALPRPDSLYGVSKAAMEALGSYYADEWALETTSIRIGSCVPVPTTERMLATWLSPDDLTRLMLAAIDHAWRGHRIVWGISRNTRRWWSLLEGEAIGYHPRDDAERFASLLGCPTGHGSEFAGGSGPPGDTGYSA